MVLESNLKTLASGYTKVKITFQIKSEMAPEIEFNITLRLS